MCSPVSNATQSAVPAPQKHAPQSPPPAQNSPMAPKDSLHISSAAQKLAATGGTDGQ
jgi:hypothetical protein